MFNALTPAEVTLAIGRVLREAADADPDAGVDEYRRSQLLSACSVTRHLAAEHNGAPQLLPRFLDEVAPVLASLAGDKLAAADRVVTAADGSELGAAVAELLECLRDTGPEGRGARSALHGALARLADHEVAALAAAPA